MKSIYPLHLVVTSPVNMYYVKYTSNIAKAGSVAVLPYWALCTNGFAIRFAVAVPYCVHLGSSPNLHLQAFSESPVQNWTY